MKEAFEKIKVKCLKDSRIGRTSLEAFIEIVNQVAEEYSNTAKMVVNEEIKNAFANVSTVGCVNCDHKDEYIIEMEKRYVGNNDGWIPVEDGLPSDDGKEYLAQKKNGRIEILGFARDAYKLDRYDFAEYRGKKKPIFYDYDSEYGYIELECVAWRELPQQYKPKKEEKNCDNCANNTDWDEVDRGCYMCCKGLENNYEPKGE